MTRFNPFKTSNGWGINSFTISHTFGGKSQSVKPQWKKTAPEPDAQPPVVKTKKKTDAGLPHTSQAQLQKQNDEYRNFRPDELTDPKSYLKKVDSTYFPGLKDDKDAGRLKNQLNKLRDFLQEKGNQPAPVGENSAHGLHDRINDIEKKRSDIAKVRKSYKDDAETDVATVNTSQEGETVDASCPPSLPTRLKRLFRPAPTQTQVALPTTRDEDEVSICSTLPEYAEHDPLEPPFKTMERIEKKLEEIERRAFAIANPNASDDDIQSEPVSVSIEKIQLQLNESQDEMLECAPPPVGETARFEPVAGRIENIRQQLRNIQEEAHTIVHGPVDEDQEILSASVTMQQVEEELETVREDAERTRASVGMDGQHEPISERLQKIENALATTMNDGLNIRIASRFSGAIPDRLKTINQRIKQYELLSVNRQKIHQELNEIGTEERENQLKTRHQQLGVPDNLEERTKELKTQRQQLERLAELEGKEERLVAQREQLQRLDNLQQREGALKAKLEQLPALAQREDMLKTESARLAQYGKLKQRENALKENLAELQDLGQEANPLIDHLEQIQGLRGLEQEENKLKANLGALYEKERRALEKENIKMPGAEMIVLTAAMALACKSKGMHLGDAADAKNFPSGMALTRAMKCLRNMDLVEHIVRQTPAIREPEVPASASPADYELACRIANTLSLTPTGFDMLKQLMKQPEGNIDAAVAAKRDELLRNFLEAGWRLMENRAEKGRELNATPQSLLLAAGFSPARPKTKDYVLGKALITLAQNLSHLQRGDMEAVKNNPGNWTVNAVENNLNSNESNSKFSRAQERTAKLVGPWVDRAFNKPRFNWKFTKNKSAFKALEEAPGAIIHSGDGQLGQEWRFLDAVKELREKMEASPGNGRLQGREDISDPLKLKSAIRIGMLEHWEKSPKFKLYQDKAMGKEEIKAVTDRVIDQLDLSEADRKKLKSKEIDAIHQRIKQENKLLTTQLLDRWADETVGVKAVMDRVIDQLALSEERREELKGSEIDVIYEFFRQQDAPRIRTLWQQALLDSGIDRTGWKAFNQALQEAQEQRQADMNLEAPKNREELTEGLKRYARNMNLGDTLTLSNGHIVGGKTKGITALLSRIVLLGSGSVNVDGRVEKSRHAVVKLQLLSSGAELSFGTMKVIHKKIGAGGTVGPAADLGVVKLGVGGGKDAGISWDESTFKGITFRFPRDARALASDPEKAARLEQLIDRIFKASEEEREKVLEIVLQEFPEVTVATTGMSGKERVWTRMKKKLQGEAPDKAARKFSGDGYSTENITRKMDSAHVRAFAGAVVQGSASLSVAVTEKTNRFGSQDIGKQMAWRWVNRGAKKSASFGGGFAFGPAFGSHKLATVEIDGKPSDVALSTPYLEASIAAEFYKSGSQEKRSILIDRGVILPFSYTNESYYNAKDFADALRENMDDWVHVSARRHDLATYSQEGPAKDKLLAEHEAKMNQFLEMLDAEAIPTEYFDLWHLLKPPVAKEATGLLSALTMLEKVEDWKTAEKCEKALRKLLDHKKSWDAMVPFSIDTNFNTTGKGWDLVVKAGVINSVSSTTVAKVRI